MPSEIGSEFWEKHRRADIYVDNEKIVLSGRTALDLIIRDIKKFREFKTVILPSYCCDSMIEPFIRNRISVKFYCVSETGIEYSQNDADVILLLDYFGYLDGKVTQIADNAKVNDKLVIYDSTHYLGDRKIEADYIFCSYRKWFFCNFASVRKINGLWNVPDLYPQPEQYANLRNTAAKLKETYINEKSGNKQKFLQLFSEAEELLETDYVNYSGEKKDFDFVEISQKRRKNAKILIDRLREIEEIKIWKKTVNENDTPLFVPILIPTETRNRLRIHLIENNIFCPVHWPLTDFHGDYRAIFENELSLICDQRYSEEDIDREVEVIYDFFKSER